MPSHRHQWSANTSSGNAPIPNNTTVLGAFNNAYRDSLDLTDARAGTIANTGGGQAHENMQPFLALNFCIALQGLFPSRN